MAVAAGAFAADLDGLVPRNRLHRARLGGLQRGDAGLHPRPGLADAPDRTRRMGRMDEHLRPQRSEEHTSELQSLMRISYAAFCLTKKKQLVPRIIRMLHR